VGFRIGDEGRKERLQADLAGLVERLKIRGVRRIILFGSLARGDVGPSSDIDLLVVQETHKPFMARLDEFYDLFDERPALDILVYTPDEIASLAETNSFVRQTLREGKVLYEA